MKNYSYLALGDSYTVGEQVSLAQSFPYQTVQLLRKAGYFFYAPEIIAKTGWTTDELKLAVEDTTLLGTYDMVSLLIGVNNQYRGGSVDSFRLHFRLVLEFAIQRAGGIANNVMVMSIPDWGVTPYAIARTPEKIRSEIDMYNFICQAEAEYYQANFLDITTTQRLDGNSAEFLAADQLHPSGKEYFKWAEKLAKLITDRLNG
jgi:lysophospholipase L1-like esterase